MNLKIYFYTIILSITSLLMSSQNKWTLEDCVNYALDNNIQIKQQALNVKLSENRYVQSKAGVLPTLNGNSSQNFTWGRSVDPYTNDFTENDVNSNNFSLSSSFIVFNGFQNINKIKQNKFELLASIQDVEKMKNDISLNIAAAYLQILFNQDLLENTEKQLEITSLQVERTKNMVEAGSLPQGNLLEIEAQFASDELQVVNSQNQLDISFLNLQQLLDLDSVENFGIIRPEFPELDVSIINFSIKDIYNEAVNNLPEIKSAEYMLISSEKGLSVAKGGRSPRLSISASFGTGYSNAYENYFVTDTTFGTVLSGYTQIGTGVYDVYSYNYNLNYDSEVRPFGDQIKDNKSTSLAFSLTIPIFNGLQASKAISNAKIGVLNAQYSLQLQKNRTYKEIQQKYTDVLAALKKYYSTKKAFSSIEKAFMYSQQKFDVGLMNFVDYNIAKNNFVKTQSDLIQAKYDYIFKSKILDFYKGIPIKL